jgi:hypothetical protein
MYARVLHEDLAKVLASDGDREKAIAALSTIA